MKIINILVKAALMMGGLHLHAQTVGVEYTTELQTNFRESNFVNLLRLNAEVPIGKPVTIAASTISIAKTRDERLIDDLQTFSNIEEDNLPLAIAVAGVNWQINDKHSLFMGIRNMNEDYFCSDATSFFTNSSCGIYPTISANYPIANYPVASVGMHYCYDGAPIKVQASLYNGTGNNRFTGRNNVFRFCPKDDGIFGIAEVSYTHGNSHYSLGNAMHSNESTGITPWFYMEQSITSNLTLLAGYSHAFNKYAECKDFIGFGAHYLLGKYQLGLFTDYANYGERNEFATELTCRIPISEHIHIQPTAHFITYDSRLRSVAMLRMAISY